MFVGLVHVGTHEQGHQENLMSCDILHLCLCVRVHRRTCAPLFLGWVPCAGGQAGAPKGP